MPFPYPTPYRSSVGRFPTDMQQIQCNKIKGHPEAVMAKSKQLTPKKIGNSDMIGARGVNLIERRILEMGYVWYPSQGVEAGIDGRLEIRNQDAEVTNCILSVQSKATRRLFRRRNRYRAYFRMQ
jgi:hypothetical protein